MWIVTYPVCEEMFHILRMTDWLHPVIGWARHLIPMGMGTHQTHMTDTTKTDILIAMVTRYLQKQLRSLLGLKEETTTMIDGEINIQPIGTIPPRTTFIVCVSDMTRNTNLNFHTKFSKLFLLFDNNRPFATLLVHCTK